MATIKIQPLQEQEELQLREEIRGRTTFDVEYGSLHQLQL